MPTFRSEIYDDLKGKKLEWVVVGIFLTSWEGGLVVRIWLNSERLDISLTCILLVVTSSDTIYKQQNEGKGFDLCATSTRLGLDHRRCRESWRK